MIKFMKISLITILSLSIIIILYNVHHNERVNCTHLLRENAKGDSLSQQIVKQMRDSVIKWHKDSVLRFSTYGTTDYWHFDNLVIFNKKRTRAYSFFYRSPKDSSKVYSSIHPYLAELTGNIWRFYLAGMPSIGYFKHSNNGKVVTIQQLIAKTNVQLADHLKIFKCEFEDDLVDKWFKNIDDLKYMENKFWREE